MSSTYRALCLSHTPALIAHEYTYEQDLVIDKLDHRDGLGDHQNCDIILGRWSGGLCELACLGRQLPGPSGCKGYHARIEWTDRDWLRLLAAARPHVASDLIGHRIGDCWPIERLRTLHVDLDLPLLAAKADDT